MTVEAAASAACQQDLVFDVGVHTGEDSAFYLALGYDTHATLG